MIAAALMVIAVLSALPRPQSLAELVRKGDVAGLESALARLENAADVDERDEHGRTALALAALRNDEAMVKTLLEAGANPNLADDEGDTPLLLAGGRNLSVLRALVEARADVNAANSEGRTPLIVAAQQGPEPVSILIEAGANVSRRDGTGVTALVVAKAAGDSEVEKLLRDAGARESLEERLHESIRSGDEASVRKLIEEGADVNALDTDVYQTPLMAAIRYRKLDILVRLVEAGADPTIEGTGIGTEGDNAILVAAMEGSPWALRLLLETRSRPEEAERALDAGCAHQGVVRVALEKGARVDSRGAWGRTPLICAAAAGSMESVSLLLAAGADPALQSDDGRTAREWAEDSGHGEVAALLAKAAR